MIFRITYTNQKKELIKAESWLDLLTTLSKDVVKVERSDSVEIDNRD